MKISHAAFAVVILAAIQGSYGFNKTLGWQTLYQGAPVIVANGGSSGVYPDQTIPAYMDATNTSSFPLALLCDLQLTKDNQGICRTGWNLSTSTNLTGLNSSVLSTYTINGESLTGYFSVDYALSDLLNATAIQSVDSRESIFDGYFRLQRPEDVSNSIAGAPAGLELYVWLNVEYPTFYQQHPGRNSLASYLTTFLKNHSPAFLSATEVGILRLLKTTAFRSRTSLIFKVLHPDLIEESTNTTYGDLLKNLTDIATFAEGILVPKELIYAVDNTTNYLQSASGLVQAAHQAKLEVYVYKFANDDYPSSYNISFDPVREYLDYLGDSFTVDGFVTDFPTTASEAIYCYPDGYQSTTSSSKVADPKGRPVKQPTIISHNGASGDFPGCTMSAYMAAIDDGADYIDCRVQISSDGVPICREDPNLLLSTNVLTTIFYQDYVTTYPELQPAPGVFTFDMSWANISTLKADMNSPWSEVYKVFRNRGNDGKEGILTLDDFLVLAKNFSTVGIYINLQNAYYLRTVHNLDVVDAVVTSLTKANLTNASDKVLLASEDSSALAAIQHLLPDVKLVYDVKYTTTNPISVTLPVLQEIKKYANIVALDRRLVDPVDHISNAFLATKTSVVSSAQSLNMTVFYYFLSNEYVAYAADYRSDPTLQINSLITNYNIDGFLTDFPSTLYAFVHKNYCYRQLNYSAGAYYIFDVMPGDVTIQPFNVGAIAVGTSPPLAVVEPPISYFVPLGAPPGPSGVAGGPAPTAQPSAALSLSSSLFPAVILMFVASCLMI